MLAHNKSLTNNCLIVSWPKSLLGFFCNILRKNLNFLANPISDYGKTWEAGRSIWHQMHLCTPLKGLPRWLSGEESAWQCRRHGFNPRVEKVPWRRKWQPTPGFLPGKSHGQRSLVGYSPWGHKESDAAEQPNNNTLRNLWAGGILYLTLTRYVNLSFITWLRSIFQRKGLPWIAERGSQRRGLPLIPLHCLPSGHVFLVKYFIILLLIP